MDALKRSLGQSGGDRRKPAKAASKPAAHRKAPAKKRA
jgi:hypothetical protein